MGKMDYSKIIEGARLGLRIFTSICLLISVVVTATDKLALTDGTKASFNDIHGYRYVLAIGVIGLTYTLIQMGLSIYQMVKNNKRLIAAAVGELADLFLSWLLASAVGTGFGVTAELKNVADQIYEGDFGDDVDVSAIFNFFDQGNIATGTLFVAFFSMALIVILSSFTRSYHHHDHTTESVPVKPNDVEAQSQDQAQTQTQAQAQVQVVD